MKTLFPIMLIVLACALVFTVSWASLGESSAAAPEVVGPNNSTPPRKSKSVDHLEAQSVGTRSTVNSKDGGHGESMNHTEEPQAAATPQVEVILEQTLATEMELLYGELNALEVHAVWQSTNREYSLQHRAAMGDAVNQGGGVLTDANNIGFDGSPGEDEIWGAFFDEPSQAYYNVKIDRFADPELFVKRDEVRWLGKRVIDLQ
jgi:hypothetical protein